MLGTEDKLTSDVLLWTPTHGHTSVGYQAKTYIYQHCASSGCHLEDLSIGMDGESQGICAVSIP